uniref:Uncharacterized protein n=1 Tax=Physcomitrium patens TaxID=3218 RepID=A0A2K1KAH0_PHYPA|nr:hypothetical protein PHYPA_009961 [Physcomitrium patens]
MARYNRPPLTTWDNAVCHVCKHAATYAHENFRVQLRRLGQSLIASLRTVRLRATPVCYCSSHSMSYGDECWTSDAVFPTIVDDGFKLHESHAILRYLATTRDVADHWYPKDPKRRALIDSVVDWHHLHLRRNAFLLVMHRVISLLPGIPKGIYPEHDEAVAKESKTGLDHALDYIDTVLLKGPNGFLENAEEVSIADLSLVCEIKQLLVPLCPLSVSCTSLWLASRHVSGLGKRSSSQPFPGLSSYGYLNSSSLNDQNFTFMDKILLSLHQRE